jgi:hypothetical protein
VQTPVDERLRAEAKRYRLQFTCEACAHFDGNEACSHGYPTQPHRAINLAESSQLEFCKEFELV